MGKGKFNPGKSRKGMKQTGGDNATVSKSEFKDAAAEAKFKKAIKERKTLSLSAIAEHEIRSNRKLDDVLLSLRQAADLLGISKGAMNKRVQRNTVEAHWYENKWYVWRNSLIAPVRLAIRNSR